MLPTLFGTIIGWITFHTLILLRIFTGMTQPLLTSITGPTILSPIDITATFVTLPITATDRLSCIGTFPTEKNTTVPTTVL